MTTNQLRIMERQLEECGVDIDTIIWLVDVAQKERNYIASRL